MRTKLVRRNKRYENGANFERQIRKQLEAEGYIASRSAGSHGEFDVLAFNGLLVHAIQAKKGATEKQAAKLLDELTQKVIKKFPRIAYPISVAVVTQIVKTKLIGPGVILVPEGTDAQETEQKE